VFYVTTKRGENTAMTPRLYQLHLQIYNTVSNRAHIPENKLIDSGNTEAADDSKINVK